MSIVEAAKAGRAQTVSVPQSISRVAVAVVSAYIAAQMIADIASIKIGVVGLPLAGALAVDMGTFIYPITFTLRDVVHKLLGKRNAQALVVMAAVVNLLMVLYLMWAASVPSDPSAFGSAEFSAVFAPLWRIVVASITAEIVSELTDTEVYHWFVTRVTTRMQWLRVLVSNSISVPVDNAIFAAVAFAPITLLGTAGLPWAVVWQIFLFNLIIKYGMTLLSLPLIYIGPDREWAREA